MAIAPLFIASMDVLKSRLRLSGAAEADALAMVDAATEMVRGRIYEELGVGRTNEISALPYSENATDDNGLLRMRANNVELAMIRLELLRSMPIIFQDGAANVRERWNEEGVGRGQSEKKLEDEIKRLMNDIANGLDSLQADDSTDSAGGVRATVIGPDEEQPQPGASIRPLVWNA